MRLFQGIDQKLPERSSATLLLTDSWIFRMFLLIVESAERSDTADESGRLARQVEGLLQDFSDAL